MGDLLKGKVAIVTGAGNGIGKAVAIDLAREGATVVVIDPGASRDGKGESSLAPAEQTVADIKAEGGNALASTISVTDFKAVEALFADTKAKFGSVDIVVNCAGILREKMIWNMSEEDWDAVINVHLKGTWNLCRHAAPIMREQKYGRIINLTSDAWRGTVGQCNYGAAKGGIVSLTRAVCNELGRYGVTANNVAPVAATRMTVTDEVKKGMEKRLAAGLVTKAFYDSYMNMNGPEFISPIITYLASDAAADINGQVFHIERGRVAIYNSPVEVKAAYKTQDAGLFTVEDLIDMVPKTLLIEYKNPAPAEASK